MMDEIPIEKLIGNNYNPRKYFDDAKMKELQNSMEKQGIVQAITVRPIPDDMYEVVAGMRRFIVAKRLGLTTIPCMVKELTDKEARLLSITENLERADLTVMEEACWFADYLEWDEQGHFEGKKPKTEMYRLTDTLTSMISMSRDTVYKRLSLLHLPEKLQIRVDQGTLKVKCAEAIARLKELWKIKVTNMSAEDVDTKRDQIKADIHKTMEGVVATSLDGDGSYSLNEEETRSRVNRIINLEQQNVENIEKQLKKAKSELDKAVKKLTDIDEDWEDYHNKLASQISVITGDNTISDKRILLTTQHDRYDMNLKYVTELALGTCPHCGAGVDVDFLKERIQELRSEIAIINKEEEGLTNELKDLRKEKNKMDKLIETYRTKKTIYIEQAKVLGVISDE